MVMLSYGLEFELRTSKLEQRDSHSGWYSHTGILSAILMNIVLHLLFHSIHHFKELPFIKIVRQSSPILSNRYPIISQLDFGPKEVFKIFSRFKFLKFALAVLTAL